MTGRLLIFLGYAAGVGKTYKMLDDAQRRHRQGADIVIGYFEPHDRPDTIALTHGIESVPNRNVVYRGVSFIEMDTDAILARRPGFCVIDELPHTNIPGSARHKRWQDVQLLLDAGIHVLTTMNIQHLESLNDQIVRLSGVKVRETVPDWVLQRADEVVMVDLTPRALIHRLERGVVYPHDQARRALENFFRESTLSALRELALRQTAQRLDTQTRAKSQDRLLVVITPDPSTAMVVRRAKRVADYLNADCHALHVAPPTPPPSPDTLAALDRHLDFARLLRLDTQTLAAPDHDSVPATIVAFARTRHITQIFCARAPQPRDPLIRRLVRLAHDIQITVVAPQSPATIPRQ